MNASIRLFIFSLALIFCYMGCDQLLSEDRIDVNVQVSQAVTATCLQYLKEESLGNHASVYRLLASAVRNHADVPSNMSKWASDVEFAAFDPAKSKTTTKLGSEKNKKLVFASVIIDDGTPRGTLRSFILAYETRKLTMGEFPFWQILAVFPSRYEKLFLTVLEENVLKAKTDDLGKGGKNP